MIVHTLERYEWCSNSKVILDDDCDWLLDRITFVTINHKREFIGSILVRCNKGSGGNGSWPMGRAVLEFNGQPRPKDKTQVCHENDNPMDNRLENLFWGSREDNTWMKGPRKGFKGVYFVKGRSLKKPWEGRITKVVDGKRVSIFCKCFLTEIEAAHAVDNFIRELQAKGEAPPRVYLNFPKEGEWKNEKQRNADSKLVQVFRDSGATDYSSRGKTGTWD